MVTRPNMFEQFLMMFDAVKHHTNGEPKRIETFYGQSDKLTEAVDNLRNFLSRNDFKNVVIYRSKKKYHRSVPTGFQEAFVDYENRWESNVVLTGYKSDPELLEAIKELVASIPQDERANSKQGEHDNLIPPDPDYEDSFDPSTHEGAAAFDMAFWATQSYADWPDEDIDTTRAAARIGLDAYDYLRSTIGFDPDTVFRRWRRLPVIFMPAHVSNRHSDSEKGSLMDLIDEAARAFVFGAPAASIAACRAALEMVLKHHYGIEHQYRNKKGEVRDKGLGHLIILADERYEFIQGKRLQKLSDGANRILHQYQSRRRLSDEDEATILEFFTTLKFLVERAPS